MSLVNSKKILAEARQKKYGIPSLLAGNLEMVVGCIKAAEERRSPLILAFNQEVTPQIPLELGLFVAASAAHRVGVPVATILDHGHNLEEVVRAIKAGTSSVMFDGASLPFEENIRQTREVVKLAHAVGVCVEAELGGIAGSSINLGESGPESQLTDPEQAAEFVERTGVDVLAISFGNAHGVYRGEPDLDLDRVRKIRELTYVPLAMHGASGLPESYYAKIIESGISKVCYYTAMGLGAGNSLRQMMAEGDEKSAIYHRLISRAIDYFYHDTKRLLDLLGCSGQVKNEAKKESE
jgi:fructose-bisphosphate aldolase class II